MTVQEAMDALGQAALGETGTVKVGEIEYVLVPRDAVQLLMITVAAAGSSDESDGAHVTRRMLRQGKIPDMPNLHPEQR